MSRLNDNNLEFSPLQLDKIKGSHRHISNLQTSIYLPQLQKTTSRIIREKPIAVSTKNTNNVCQLSEIANVWVNKSIIRHPRQKASSEILKTTTDRSLVNRYKIHTRPSRFVEHHPMRPRKIDKSYSEPRKELLNSTLKYRKMIQMKSQADLTIPEVKIKVQYPPKQLELKVHELPLQISSKLLISPGKRIQNFNELMYGNRVTRQLLNQQAPNFFTKSGLQQKYKQIRLQMLHVLTYLSKLKISPKEFMSNKIFSNKPFDRDNSRQFIQYCKMNKVEQVQNLLEKNKYLVYEYDHIVMTSLHWACLRGHYQIVHLLLNHGADPDAEDIVGRTPLYLALSNNKNEVAQLLLTNNADPWNRINCNYHEAIANNPRGKEILSSSRKVRVLSIQFHILLKMTPPSQRYLIWQKEQIQYYELRSEDLKF